MADPLLTVNWVGEILRVRTATGDAVPAGDAVPGGKAEPGGKAADPKDGDGKTAAAEERKPERPLLRGLDLPRNNEKPVLVYFHWPHEDGDRGKRIVKFCGGPLDDEAFVRTAPLFHCVEVNTKDSEANLVAEAKVTTTPALLLCAPDGTIFWRSEDAKVSGKALAAALRKALAEEMPARWAEIEKEMKFQVETLREGKALAARKKWEDAAFALRQVVGSDVRFTGEWEEARTLLREAEAKAEEEAKK